MAAGLEFGLTGPALKTGLPPIPPLRRIQGLEPGTGGFEALSDQRGMVCCATSHASCEEERMPPKELQQFLWQQYFADRTEWWDYRRSKPTPRHPDFRHKKSKVALWLNNRHKPAWVDSQLITWDAGMTGPPESVCTSVEYAANLAEAACPDDHLEIGACRKLCEDGRITDAVESLNLLVQRGCHVPNNLFYLVLKWCIVHKDLALGTRIHALTVQNGYEGDAFLATHLIGLYASHGRLAEAMRVFTKVPKPDAYNWATIIFAYARHGEAAEAIRLYRQMRDSTNIEPTDHIYVAVLKACATAGDLVAGKEVHAHILSSPVEPNIFVQTGLVHMYAHCGSLEDARKVFDTLPQRDVVTWTAMIAGYTQQGMGQEALSLYGCMQQEGVTPPDSVTFVCLLQACASVGAGALHQGKQLHAQIEEGGLQTDVVLGGSLVNMYAKCGSLEDARSMFERLRARDVVTWTAMIAGYAQQGMGQEALSLYSRMQQEALIAPDSVTFVCLLQACASVGALPLGKKLNAQIEERGLQEALGGSLVNMYAKCGSLDDARSFFDRLLERNVVTWTAMIAGYAQQEMGQEALSLYTSMQREGITPPDSVTFACLLQACASIGVGALHQGKQLHKQIEEQRLHNDVVLGGSLVNMYAKCGSVEDARSVFDKLTHRNVVTWNAMLTGYAHQGMGQKVLSLYSSMQQEGLTPPDSVTFVCLLQACAGEGALHQGKQLHAQIEERGLQDDAVLGGSLVNMYAKCGSLEDARRVFDRLLDRNVVTWNAMLAGYAHHRMGQEALTLYNLHQGIAAPNSLTFASLLQACASVGEGALHQGKQFHAQIVELGLRDDIVLGGCLVNMYAKCGSLEDARSVFDKLKDRDVVTWTAMIAGYAQQGMCQEALSLYSSMQQEGITSADSVTFVCLLQACAIIAALPLGEELHAQIEELGLQADPVVGAGLVNMYARCGSMVDSQKVFDSLPERTIEAWNALTGGYSRLGDSEVVFDLIDRMRLEGIQPNGITFLSMLTVCSHVGLVDKGRKYFEAMRTDYGISPTLEHYTCMMDLLGRAGHLDESLQMGKTMPFLPDSAVWLTLLGACRKWNNVEIGQQAFEFAVGVDGKDAASYVLMSNIYASAQMWEEAKEMQARRVKFGAWKKPGQSWWTDMGGVVHTFVVGDKKHPESEGIYARLQQLVPKMKKEGYVPHLQSSLRDIPDEDKEAELCGHSEKLAIAYALNRTPEGTTIRVVKNLRVCVDCHTATAYISKVEKRTIICRDASRFHVYQEGKCSCGDYW